ncbi:hypothetical protein ABE142_19735 [Paenibacillus alvei]|uniref:hypothetical protein n=1 Tax=Paenibacillus alvei TaxID=44250 RepID=UPI003D2B5144
MNATEEFLLPWILETSNLYVDELHKEISEEHILFDQQLAIVARRIDRDDVLFQFVGKPNQYAQVHLTWKRDPKKLRNGLGQKFLIHLTRGVNL